jgi:prepilin peptidase CpaA
VIESIGTWILTYWSAVILGVVLVLAAVTDVRTGRIYNWTTYPAIIVGLIGHALLGGWAGNEHSIGLLGAAAGLTVGAAPLFLVWMLGAIGGGDVKLMGVVGVLAGWRFALAGLFYGLLAAVAISLIVILFRKVTFRTLGRVFRFFYLLLVRAKPAVPTSEDSPKIPFGLALCIGSGLALAEVMVRGPFAAKLVLGI